MHLDLIPYLLLLLAVIAGWITEVRFSIFFLGLAMAAGLAFGTLTPIGALWIGILGLSLWLPATSKLTGPVRFFSFGIFLLLALAMASHLLPGFNNLPIFQDVQFSPDSIPFTMYLNFDQTVVGLFVFLFFLKSRQPPNFGKERFLITAKAMGLLSLLILTAVFAIGYVRTDPKFPHLGWIWVLNNLFFVCLAEEALFRGFIQKNLSEMFPKTKTYFWIPIVLAALLFGLAHYKGGAALIALATVSGLFFGYAYQKTDRIESPILVHFGLNLVHFVFFSYPALIPKL
jgi:membrane protease YdiL (CAAX protease family)